MKPSTNNHNTPQHSPKKTLIMRRNRQIDNLEWRKVERMLMLLTCPHYHLLHPGRFLFRFRNRLRLRFLLRILLSRRRWADACGVLSVLIQATCGDLSAVNSRFKYTVAMELFRHLENDPDIFSSKIENLFNAWRRSTRRPKSVSYLGLYLKDKYIIMEYILSCVARNKLKDALLTLPSLKQEVARAGDPMLNLVIGLTHYEEWYSALVEKMRTRNLNDFCISSESETTRSDSSGVMDNMETEDATSINEAYSNLHYPSETSVVFSKKGDICFRQNSNKEAPEACANPQVEHHQPVLTQGSVDTSEASGGSVKNPNDRIHHSSVLNAHALQSLLPFRMPLSMEVEDLLSKEFSNTSYENAFKYLEPAVNSSPPISEAALLPLIQLKLLGGKVNEVFSVLENSCNESSSVVPYRLRASVQESFDAKNYNKLSSCFEDVLEKDPTCSHSLKKLINLCQRGEYATRRLIEMIALHLEATFGDHIAWSEFASCLLRISQCEEDAESTCRNGEEVEIEHRRTTRSLSIPVMFLEGTSGKTWKLRAKWWLNRHFSKHILMSEVEKGDWKLMAYKAACASHLYGRDIMYVVNVHSCLKEHDNSLSSFLCTHMDNSAGFISNFVKK